MIGRFALASSEKVADSLLGALVGKAVEVAVQQFCEQRGVEDDRKQLQDSLDHARILTQQIEQQGYEAGNLADAEDDRGSIQLLSLASPHMGGDVDAIHLEGLDEESLWKFFKECAFGSSNSEVHHPHLEAMAKKMMCMLKGSPLAAKILGGLLSMKLDEQHWKSILDSELWQLPQEENGIMSELQLSYQYLPPHLKQCFEFCSLFPKNYRFSESELIGLWMAEGFIEPQESIRMEELASNYFHELVNRSFFQKSKDRDFIMHNLIYDLAELSSVESLRHGMIKLINLRKLDRLDKFIDKITKIGKLTSLQNLSVFKVLKDNGHKLIELNGLKQLRGGLCITNLENVENKDETNIASLNSKEDLDELELEWTSLQEFDSDVNLHISEQVLEGLQSHHNLQSLTIRGYNGARPPNWLHEQVYSRLETLQLQNCKNWNDLVVVRQLSQIKHLCLVRIPVQTQNLHNLFNPEHCKFFSQLEELVLEGIIMLEDLPNLGQLPCLKSLSIQSLPGVKMIGDRFFATTEEGSCFPRLHSLSFHEMPAWEEFHFSNDRNLFPCLVLLHISNCQKLLMLPRLPPSITCLQLKNVGLEDCPRFWKAIDEGSSITNSASVTELYI
ncbi:hypothetical protein ZIOFF_004620 [Zingiber officinale]|uniref:NB-ARC domain-containing protein n=1 Tax=Zingiber officinale TaxID=94328 RepID=A0A8J5HUE9_ZINOF|nr:hypothetical protein ZIOFF_004620 [Zingiber officinale]